MGSGTRSHILTGIAKGVKARVAYAERPTAPSRLPPCGGGKGPLDPPYLGLEILSMMFIFSSYWVPYRFLLLAAVPVERLRVSNQVGFVLVHPPGLEPGTH